MKYQILDWAGNTMFDGELFDSFEDAWEKVYEYVRDDESYFDEYQVIEVD